MYVCKAERKIVRSFKWVWDANTYITFERGQEFEGSTLPANICFYCIFCKVQLRSRSSGLWGIILQNSNMIILLYCKLNGTRLWRCRRDRRFNIIVLHWSSAPMNYNDKNASKSSIIIINAKDATRVTFGVRNANTQRIDVACYTCSTSEK